MTDPDDLDLSAERTLPAENRKRIQLFVEALTKLTQEHGILISASPAMRIFNIRRPSDGAPIPGRYYFCESSGFGGRVDWLAE